MDNKLFKSGERVAIAASGGKGEDLIRQYDFMCGLNFSYLVELVYLDFCYFLLIYISSSGFLFFKLT